MSKRFLSGINVTGTATLNTVANAGLDTDKFLVLDAAGNIDFRTGDELKIDIGANVVSRIEHEVKLGETMSIGTPVYVGVDLNAGTNMTVYKASNATEAMSSKTMGLVASSGITNDLVEVITEGLLEGLNTSTATKGDPVWLGVDGALIFGLANKPVAPAHLVSLGVVTRVQSNNGEIFVKVQNGFEMNEIHNYLEGSVQNNQVIVYESATSLYKPKSISTILGFTPSDDSSVVKLAGAQVITGAKSFDAAITVNAGIGFLNGVMPNITSNLYTGIGGNSQGISIVTRPVSTNYTNNLYFATSNNSFTFPNATGTIALTSDLTAYVPSSRTITINGTTYDLSANRAWTITTDASARTILRYVATANQTTFTISGGYTPGLTDVYRNGVKLDNSTDFTATNGTTIVLTNGASVNDVIEVYRYQTAFLANNALRVVTEFTATAGQTTFNVTYNSGLVDVFYNGSKLLSTEYAAGNGTTIVLNFPCNLNDTLEVHAYSYAVGAFTGQAQLNGTGFVKVSGTTVSYDNSTYLTTSSASSTYLPLTGGTLTGALSGTSATFSGNLNQNAPIFIDNSNHELASFSNNNLQLFFSSIYDGTNVIAKSGAGGRIVMNGGAFSFQTFGSATIGNAVTPIERFAISNGGAATFSNNLAVGGSTDDTSGGLYSNIALNGSTYSRYSLLTGGTARARFQFDGTNTTLTTTSTGGKLQLATFGAAAMEFVTNDTLRLTIASTGAATFSSSVTAKTSGDYRQATLGTSTGAALYITNSIYDGYGLLIGNSYSYGESWIQAGRVDGTATAYNLTLQAAGGNVLIGTTSDNGDKLAVLGERVYIAHSVSNRDIAYLVNSSASPYGMNITFTGAAPNNTTNNFIYLADSNGLKCRIVSNGSIYNSTGTYGAISDERFKENIVNASPKLENLLKVKVRNFNLIGDEKKQIGVIAQELEDIFPSLVEESTDKETNITSKSVKYSVFVPMLIKAIQEQQAQIEELTEKVNALENK